MKVLHWEANSMNDVDVLAYRKLAGIDQEVILNMNQTGLFSSIFYKNDLIKWKKMDKQSKIRITIALCLNAIRSRSWNIQEWDSLNNGWRRYDSNRRIH